MARVYLSIGSNVDREKNIRASLDALHRRFGKLLLSSVYESEAVGFCGENFFNLVAGIVTDLSVGELATCLRRIEHANGRRRDTQRFSPRTLDIDILTYDDLVGDVDGVGLPRKEVTENAFVLQPLAEVAGAQRHPRLQVSYAELWRRYNKRQKLWPVSFLWQGKKLPLG